MCGLAFCHKRASLSEVATCLKVSHWKTSLQKAESISSSPRREKSKTIAQRTLGMLESQPGPTPSGASLCLPRSGAGLDSPGSTHGVDSLVPAWPKGRARAPGASCSVNWCIVLVCQGLALAQSTIDGPRHGVTLANSKGLSSPGQVPHMIVPQRPNECGSPPR